MPMPPTLPQKWDIPGSEDVLPGRFGSQRRNHPSIHLRRHSILRKLNSVVSSGLGTHSLQLAQLALHNPHIWANCYCFAISPFLLTYSGKSDRLDDPILFVSIPLG